MIQVVVTLDDVGHLQVQMGGQIENKATLLGMLELAKHTIASAPAEERLIEPAGVLPFPQPKGVG